MAMPFNKKTPIKKFKQKFVQSYNAKMERNTALEVLVKIFKTGWCHQLDGYVSYLQNFESHAALINCLFVHLDGAL